MDRLSLIDSMFLDLEQSGPSVAVGSVMEIGGKAPTIDELREYIKGRLKKMPRFHQAVVSSRTKVRHAKWVNVKPDLEHHVREVKLKRGESLDHAVSELMEIPLDRTKPLWDCTLVRGYSTKKFAVITRIHHTVADGQGAVILLGQLIDLSPEGGMTMSQGIEMMAQPTDATEPEEEVSLGRLDDLETKVLGAIETGFEGLGKFISTYPDTVRTLITMLPQRSTELGGMVSSKRKWVGGQYSLVEVKKARKSFKGVTINDMVLASVAVGFTRLLQSRGEDPNGRTLRAVMPVSLRKNFDSNNQVSILPAPLPLGDMDPVKRMHMIRKSTKVSKRSMLPQITDQALKITQKLSPAPIQEKIISKSGSAVQYFSETLVTNVPGPQIPLYFMGRQAVAMIPIIPIEGSLRIIVGITSFQDQLNIGITGDGQYANDVDVLLAGVQEGFGQLVELAQEMSAE